MNNSIVSTNRTTIHFVAGTSGGVGKTSLSAMIAQLLQAKIIDGEFINRTLSQYKGLSDISPNHKILNTQGIDTFISDIMNTIVDYYEDGGKDHIVVDVGSSILVFLFDFIRNSDVLEIFKEEYQTDVFFHGIATSSDFSSSTTVFEQISSIGEQLQNDSVVLWLNGYRDAFLNLEMRDSEIEHIKTKLGDKLNGVFEISTPSILLRELIGKYVIDKKYTIQELEDGVNGKMRTMDLSSLRRYRKPYIEILNKILKNEETVESGNGNINHKDEDNEHERNSDNVRSIPTQLSEEDDNEENEYKEYEDE